MAEEPPCFFLIVDPPVSVPRSENSQSTVMTPRVQMYIHGCDICDETCLCSFPHVLAADINKLCNSSGST